MHILLDHLLILIVFFLSVRLSDQCFGLGCLGFGGGCGSSCLFGLCLQAPMIQSIGCPCGASFMCIRGGCVARAAAGTKTFRDDSSKVPGVKETTTPDEHFSTCCSLLDVPSTCSALCSYDSYTSEEISAVLLQQSTCPVAAIRKIHFCAARGANHTDCCTHSQVPPHCHSFCDQSQDSSVNDLSLGHLQCVHYFNDIKTCFTEHANSEYFESFNDDSSARTQLIDSEDTSLGANF